MKNTNTCPKCQKHNIVRFDGSTGLYGVGNNIYLGTTMFSQIYVNVNRYICLDCGFTEEWIDTCDLDKVEKSKKAKR